ncbi:NAD-dependent epimerase/dehydratase family protein [Halorussus lipolyticus]|uniref:NAD-dependent epimerase/dehydratase family protein n=1 Tax=Halorussus lipolyticus TaxID=3034024 RepID=UPI0023E79BDE|nr:NAD-dependent epimerase/dehydratase family protein [Halorussus sp. DT80]
MSVLVTGATGFVGLNLCAALADDGEEVTGLVRQSSPVERLPSDIAVARGDITNPASLDDPMAEADSVVHLAGAVYDSSDMDAVNVEGTENVIRKAGEHGVGRVVFTSTLTVHPDLSGDLDSAYERTKAEATTRIEDADFASTVLYPTYIWGPMDFRLTRYEHVRPVVSNAVLAPPLYTHDEYNIVHVGDVVDSIRSALDGSAKQHQLVAGANVEAPELLRTIAAATDSDCRVVDVPRTLTKYSIGPVLDLLHEKNVIPVDSRPLLERADYGTVPDEMAYTAPVEQRSWKRAVADTCRWYRTAGLI